MPDDRISDTLAAKKVLQACACLDAGNSTVKSGVCHDWRDAYDQLVAHLAAETQRADEAEARAGARARALDAILADYDHASYKYDLRDETRDAARAALTAHYEKEAKSNGND